MTAPTSRQFLTALASGEGVDRVSVHLESTASSVGKARRFVERQLVSWGFPPDEDVVQRVVLTVSELATNAVLHGRSRPPAEDELIEVALSLKPDFALGVAVTDDSDALPLTPTSTSATATRGRGLVLVSALADSWMTAPRQRQEAHQGKDVWAFFRCHETSVALPRTA
ncbi:ATP-binding protein [Actinacidiphila glaucinigra]|uniref:Anti-sigma regulatory factor (Ser/Thr protein kinase) n=1 Tax=Actinacidiphila glaucinigra TaxID=235986 RepID=A0A239LSR7_9ACTN|nr:ATP-binding protein [Actinacidiphila glaucinigra]SNT33320.1 Anti-sigma regulatory factor (Ser/Thr protein kinase) [Actinacidiphila glaucinigra]